MDNKNTSNKEELLSNFGSMSEEQLKQLMDLKNQIDTAKVKSINIKSSDRIVETTSPKLQGILAKAKSFAKAYVSRGLTDKKAEEKTKSLRVLSCHGKDTLEPCPFRLDSERFKGSYFCGICGCGDKADAQLITLKNDDGTDKYSKLDFPKIYCPMEMPGFSNYTEQETDPRVSKNYRKIFIEEAFGSNYIKEHSNLDKGDDKNEQNSNNNETE